VFDGVEIGQTGGRDGEISGDFYKHEKCILSTKPCNFIDGILDICLNGFVWDIIEIAC
jgi:hypothetical protein